MRRAALILGLAGSALLVNARDGFAQLAVRAKAGTTGVGGDISFSVAPRIALRVGATVMPVKPEGTFSDLDFQVDLPSPLFTAGADLYLLGGVRLMAGVLIGAEQTNITGRYSGNVNIGGQSYSGSDLGDLTGVVTSRNIAPFVGIGFGKAVGPGVGLSLDIGGAFLGEPTLVLSANGPCTTNTVCNASLQNSLDREATSIREDFDKYAKIYPMISLGLRVGFGPK